MFIISNNRRVPFHENPPLDIDNKETLPGNKGHLPKFIGRQH